MPRKWFYFKNGKQLGPYTWKQLYMEAYNGNIEPSDLVWVEGLSGWLKAELVDNLIPPDSARQKHAAANSSSKEKQSDRVKLNNSVVGQTQANSWYFARSGQTYGPYTTAQIHSWVKEGRLKKNDLVCNEIMKEWTKAGLVKGLFLLN